MEPNATPGGRRTAARRFANSPLGRSLAVFVLLFVGGLALSRLLFEGFFPQLLWLGRPLPASLLATGVAVAGVVLWRLAGRRRPLQPAALLPLLLNLPYLLDPTVNLLRSRQLFGASLWLAALLLAKQVAAARRWRWLGPLLVAAALLPVYLLTMPVSVGRADTFEFQVVAPQLGIAHPTGYPLYLLLGKLFSLLPLSSVAWRLNFASAVLAVAAAAILFTLSFRLLARPLPAALAAVLLGLTPTFGSQAIEAEVYTLHALVVAVALLLMVEIVLGRPPPVERARRLLLALAFVLGLGLANHLTTVLLLLPAGLTLLLAQRRDGRLLAWGWLWRPAVTFLLPLALYAYLPLRWQALNGEAMGAARFVDWVSGGRFQGAWQWTAWLAEPGRYAIVGQIWLDNWGVFNLILALAGVLFLFWRERRVALLLLVTWLAYLFYALNYRVPDLAVFMIPLDVVTALFWAAGLAGLLWAAGRWTQSETIANALILICLLPSLAGAARAWPVADRPELDRLARWGAAVLALPLAPEAAILADSEKIAPLYYRQQAEGVRPDLDIVVLPDEAAYRAELDARLAAGQTVYLARFLPGLEGVYHLRSAGPLLEVSQQPLTALPAAATPVALDFGPMQLLGYMPEPEAAAQAGATAVTLYWTTTAAAQAEARAPAQVYVRLAAAGGAGPATVAAGQLPAGNYYPVSAWDAGEIVADYHLLPRPAVDAGAVVRAPAALQVAVAPAFAPPDELAWQTVAEVALPPTTSVAGLQPLRAQVGDTLLSGVALPERARPQAALPLQLSGYGFVPERLELELRPPAGQEPSSALPPISLQPRPPFVTSVELSADGLAGRYQVVAADPAGGSICGWLAPVTAVCALAEVEISGVPLPAGASNFEDKIALLEIEVDDAPLQPGGRLPITLTWQSLAPLERDYTVFIQVLDEQDRLVGQIDAWPRQGTYPTSRWQPGEIVRDEHVLTLADSLPAGRYRLVVGWYLLETLRRLPLLDAAGEPVDDKVTVPGLIAP